jgi:hypothetical protein
MAVEQPTPGVVAQPSRRRGRIDDVGEQHGRQHAIEHLTLRIERGEEPVDRRQVAD